MLSIFWMARSSVFPWTVIQDTKLSTWNMKWRLLSIDWVIIASYSLETVRPNLFSSFICWKSWTSCNSRRRNEWWIKAISSNNYLTTHTASYQQDSKDCVDKKIVVSISTTSNTKKNNMTVVRNVHTMSKLLNANLLLWAILFNQVV